MKIKFGALVVDGRGKIGGHVASKNRSGAYMRTKVTPVNRNSPTQIQARDRLTSVSKAWRNLSASAISAWNAAVSDFSRTDIFGDVKNPTGFTLYQRLNNNALRCGGSAIALPPALTTVVPVTTFTPSVVHGGAVSIIFAASPVPANMAYSIAATKALSAGINFVKSEYRNISVIAAAGTTPYTATANYSQVFGTPGAAGAKVFFQIRVCDLTTGIMSAAKSTSVIIS